MKKIPGLFPYDPATLVRGARAKGTGARYLDKVTAGCEWVTEGQGVATEKIDGSACMVEGNRLWKRYDAKRGKTPPEGFRPAQESPDPVTQHWPGWLPVGPEPASQYHRKAWEDACHDLSDGTYEIVGPHFQTNPYGLGQDVLIRHGSLFRVAPPADLDRSFAGLAAFLGEFVLEGIVFHHPDGRMAKVTRAGFGIPWPAPAPATP